MVYFCLYTHNNYQDIGILGEKKEILKRERMEQNISTDRVKRRITEDNTNPKNNWRNMWVSNKRRPKTKNFFFSKISKNIIIIISKIGNKINSSHSFFINFLHDPTAAPSSKEVDGSSHPSRDF
uniref:Uncharacterized protein n=1 Tax=Cacopsylla melanoneura TaxID=428564 RepID=A0A8D8ZAR5_9HEMI